MADNPRIDAHCVKHNGNLVLVMSPYVAEIVHALTGLILGGHDSLVRKSTDLVWDAMMDSLWEGRKWTQSTAFNNTLEVNED